MSTNEILDMIDHTLSDYTSPDAMRWAPEVAIEPVDSQLIWERDLLTINQVREALQEVGRRHRAYRFGAGTITTVDEYTGQVVQTPFVSGEIRSIELSFRGWISATGDVIPDL